MSELTNRKSRGFTILELMIGMAIFLVLSGAILGAMANLQKNYRTAEMRTTMQQRLRATMELMAQEIGQAGLQDSTIEGDVLPATPRYTLSNAVTIGDQWVTVSPSVAGMYEGQWLQVPGGTKADGSVCTQNDAMQIESPPNITTVQIQANFGCNHVAGTAVYPMGVFPHGILAGSAGDPSTGGKLVFYGNVNGSDKGLFAVEYACVAATASQPSTLMRTEWDLSNLGTPPTQNALIDNWTACSFCWPGSTAPAGCPAGTANPDVVTMNTQQGTTVPYSMITQVGFTITVSEIATISGTNQNISVTKSYSNIQPRNIIAADNIFKSMCTAGTACTSSELQVDPPQISNPSTYGITW